MVPLQTLIVRNAAGPAKPQRDMLTSRRVNDLRLHFANQQQDDRILPTGVHRVVREANGRLSFGDSIQGALLAQFCVDRRGLWLQVAHGMRGIHVNGRPVQRMALLRAGDSVYLDGVEILVRAAHLSIDAFLPAGREDPGDPRIVLRGVGGQLHGRSFPMGQPCLVGRSHDAAIRVDEAGFAEQHARLERRGDRVLLQNLVSGSTTLVNGVPVRDAVLVAGDQVVFEGRHRFVVEVPWVGQVADENDGIGAANDEEGEPLEAAARGLQVQRWPWLLLAALLLSALLSALLLLGPG